MFVDYEYNCLVNNGVDGVRGRLEEERFPL